MWLTRTCHSILLKSTVFIHQIHLAAHRLLDTGCTQSAKAVFPQHVQNSWRIPWVFHAQSIPDFSGFPGLWTPCLRLIIVIWYCIRQSSEGWYGARVLTKNATKIVLFVATSQQSYIWTWFQTRISYIIDKPAQYTAAWRTCCKQITWMLSVINLWPN